MGRLDDVLADFATYPDLHAAGYFQRDMDDNSAVCHARRLVGRPQDIFISGGALAVRSGGPLPLFSATYNEDWLFFQRLMLEGRHMLPSSAVRYVGNIHQDAYQPFTVERALSEELGDLLAEGLFNLIEEAREDVLAIATSKAYWEGAIDERCRMISDLQTDLRRLSDGVRRGTMADADWALQASRSVYTDPSIDPAEALAEFFDALLADQNEWSRLLTALTPSPDHILSLEEALKFLDLDNHVSWFGGSDQFGWVS